MDLHLSNIYLVYKPNPLLFMVFRNIPYFLKEKDQKDLFAQNYLYYTLYLNLKKMMDNFFQN